MTRSPSIIDILLRLPILKDSEVYVPGNHEYYRSDIDYENEQMAKAGNINDIYFLNRGEVVIQGARFLGCSLWTDFACLEKRKSRNQYPWP